MFITGLGTAVPSQQYAQRECWEVVCKTEVFGQLSTRSQSIIEGVLCSDNGIATRHLAIESLAEAFQFTPDVLYARFTKHAPALASAAACRAIYDSGCKAEDIDAVLVSTCTGYLCPGLTGYVSEELGLRKNILALDLVGQGCGAALPNLRAAEAILAAGRGKRSSPFVWRFAARRSIWTMIRAC